MAKYGYYTLRFRLPDGEHVGIGNFIWANTDAKLALVLHTLRMHVMRNPDAQINPDNFLEGPFEDVRAAQKRAKEIAAELDAADPDRQSVGKLRAAGAIDHSERLLTNPEVSRLLAAHKARMNAKASSPPMPSKVSPPKPPQPSPVEQQIK